MCIAIPCTSVDWVDIERVKAGKFCTLTPLVTVTGTGSACPFVVGVMNSFRTKSLVYLQISPAFYTSLRVMRCIINMKKFISHGSWDAVY
jgi:hypothetical protein